MSPFRLALPSLLAFACAAPPAEQRPEDPIITTSECGAVVGGLDAWIAAGKTLLIGELHGTKEIPASVGVLACELSRRGPLVVGVELPAHASFETFFASDGGPEARAALLTAPAWNEAMQDGRTSEAMLGLVERLRQLVQQGRPVELLPFDARDTATRTRDRAMADLVIARRAERPDATFLLLMGNLHARKTAGSPWQPTDGYGWLASLLTEPVVSLDTSHPAGSAWLCTSLDAASCGESSVPATAHPTRTLAVRLERAGAYDGVLDVPRLTVSPPAVKR